MSRSLVDPLMQVVRKQDFQETIPEYNQELAASLGKADEHFTITGMTGGGKDSTSQVILDIDLAQGRTPIIFDTKLEYPSLIFMQQDPVLANKLNKHDYHPNNYAVTIWVPYTFGLEKNKSFQKLLKCAHPKLWIRPFRIHVKDIRSHDTKSWMLGLSQMQAMAQDEELQLGMNKNIQRGKAFKENVGRKVFIIDEHDLHTDPKKPWKDMWEYIDFEEMLSSKRVNVIVFKWFFQDNKMAGISTGLGLQNEFLSRGMDERKNTYSIYITELGVWTPKNVPQVENQVNAFMVNLQHSYFLARSFHVRMRINLQNLKMLPSTIYSQSHVFTTRTENLDDLIVIRRLFAMSDKDIERLRTAPSGTVYDCRNHCFIDMIPKAHKARKQEHFTKMYLKFRAHPENFLFNYHNKFYISDLLGSFWHSEKPVSVDYYRREAKRYLKSMARGVKRRVQPLNMKRTNIQQAKQYVREYKKKEIQEFVP